MNCLSCIVIGATATPAAQKGLIDTFATHNGIEIKSCIVVADGRAVDSIRSLRDASPSDGAWHDPIVTAHLPSAAQLVAERIPVFYCGAERVALAAPATPRDDATTRVMVDARSDGRGGGMNILTDLTEGATSPKLVTFADALEAAIARANEFLAPPATPKSAEKNGVSKDAPAGNDTPVEPIPPSHITFARPEKTFPYFLDNGDLAIYPSRVYTVAAARLHAGIAGECAKLSARGMTHKQIALLVRPKYGKEISDSTITKILAAHKMGMFDRL